MKQTKNVPVWARFFVSGTTPTSHNMKHMKDTPDWARLSCLGLPPPTSPPTAQKTRKMHFSCLEPPPTTPPPSSCQTRKTCPYGHVLRIHLIFSPKTRETRLPGRVSRSQRLPPPSNINDTPFRRVFGGRHIPSLTPYPQPPKTSCHARFQEVDLSLPTTITHHP